ncbi:MAG: hypothetical protein OEV92_08785, partial [Nitrospinota bacterium]|nr:hypothetical protein [Nitrospinota bacterium]
MFFSNNTRKPYFLALATIFLLSQSCGQQHRELYNPPLETELLAIQAQGDVDHTSPALRAAAANGFVKVIIGLKTG